MRRFFKATAAVLIIAAVTIGVVLLGAAELEKGAPENEQHEKE